MSFYESIKATAVSLIRSKGQTMTLTRATAVATYSPDTGAASAPTEALQVNGVDTGPRKRMQGGNTASVGQTEVILSPVTTTGADFTPQIGDTLTFGGKDHKIVEVSAEAPNGQTMIWNVVLSSGG